MVIAKIIVFSIAGLALVFMLVAAYMMGNDSQWRS